MYRVILTAIYLTKYYSPFFYHDREHRSIDRFERRRWLLSSIEKIVECIEIAK